MELGTTRESRLDRVESVLRRGTALAWLVPTAFALRAAWAGRSAGGRKEGRPFSQLPAWLFAAILPSYLGLLVRLWRPLPMHLGPGARLAAGLAGSTLSLLGIGFVVWGRVSLGDMYNVSSAFGVQLYRRHRLVTDGPFALVRHPIYLGAYLAGLGALLLYRTWSIAFVVAHAGVFVVRARREERALAAEFGDEWKAYHARVPGWIPRLTVLCPRSRARRTHSASQ